MRALVAGAAHPAKAPSIAIVAASLVLLAACGAVGPIQATARDDSYVLTVRVPRVTYHAADAIDVVATLTYVGTAPSARVSGDSGGLVAFRFKQLDGPLEMAPVSRWICRDYALTPGVPISQRVVKSIGFSADDPNAAFYGAWYSDPAVHLPAPTWRIEAGAAMYDGSGCGQAGSSPWTLSASITLRVLPAT